MGPESLERPLPAELTVEQARDRYLAENGFTVASYDEPSVEIMAWGLRFRLPNPASRRRAIRWHDLHHVATGFGTDPEGEALISAWEVRHGLRPLSLYVAMLVLTGWLGGLLLYHRRTRWAYARSSSGPGLFHERLGTYEQVLGLRVAELREHLGVPRDGLEDRPRARHDGAPDWALVE